MSDKNISFGKSKEEIAHELCKHITNTLERKDDKPTRKEYLDAYAECLAATSGLRTS